MLLGKSGFTSTQTLYSSVQQKVDLLHQRKTHLYRILVCVCVGDQFELVNRCTG